MRLLTKHRKIKTSLLLKQRKQSGHRDIPCVLSDCDKMSGTIHFVTEYSLLMFEKNNVGKLQ